MNRVTCQQEQRWISSQWTPGVPLLASICTLTTKPIPLSKSKWRLAEPVLGYRYHFPVLCSPLYLTNSQVKQIQNKRYIQIYLKEKIFIYITIFFLQCFHFLNSKFLQEISSKLLRYFNKEIFSLWFLFTIV